MKHFIQRRFFPVFLCMALALSLTACGGRGNQPAGDKTGDTAGTLSGSKGEKDSGAGVASGSGEETAEADLESAEASLDLLYDAMAFDDQYAGAVAYLGYRELGDSSPLSHWLQENCAGLVEAMPFLLQIPAEHILGPGYGDLFCIVPRDETTMLTVEHVTWVPSQFEVGEVTDEVLYQARSAQPVLIFKNLDDSHPLPDVHITLEPDNGPMCEWFPDVDEYDALSIPGYPENPILLDFAIWGDVTGLDYPDDWEFPGDIRWDPPTAWELAYTNWSCEHWDMEISWGDSTEPDYEGIVNLYHQPEDGQEYTLAYTGIWRMENGCLRLELSDGMGGSVSGSFPVRIDPTGDYLYIEQDWETGVCPPFFGEETYCIDLMRTYG